MVVLSKIKSHFYAVGYFKKLPFYNKTIEKPVKRLKTIDQLAKQPSVETMKLLMGMQCHIKFKWLKKSSIYTIRSK